MTDANVTKCYLKDLSDAILASPYGKLNEIADLMMSVRESGGWIYLAGNGGSSSNASHMANDLMKGLRFEGKRRFRALALGESFPIVSALANDESYDCVYSEQLKNVGTAQDILVVYSGSGNSKNILSAAEYANKIGMKVVTFTGRDGGKIKAMSNICCIAATDDMAAIEDVHSAWNHTLVTVLYNAIEKE